MTLALSGLLIGAIAAIFTRKMLAPPAYILLPALFLGILLITLVVWLQLKSAVELPSFLKK
jgi:hypothetical protein